jgi:hypothetical protein
MRSRPRSGEWDTTPVIPMAAGSSRIAVTLHGSDGTATIASSTDVAGSLRTRAPGSIENQLDHCSVAGTIRSLTTA